MELELQQTKARCGQIRADNAYECYRLHGHHGFHASRKGDVLWLDVHELPRSWAHSSTLTLSQFWTELSIQNEGTRVMLK